MRSIQVDMIFAYVIEFIFKEYRHHFINQVIKALYKNLSLELQITILLKEFAIHKVVVR